MLRAACCGSVVLGVLIAACSSDSETGGDTPVIPPPTGHSILTLDELETALLDGVEDESVPMTEAQLDQDFPVVERLTEPEKQADRDPSKGDSLDAKAAFDAFTPTENADEHFTIDVTEGTPAQSDIDRAKKGILFGMARWDDFKPGFSLTAATKARPFKVSIKTTADANPNVGFRAYVLPCGGAAVPLNGIPDIVASIANDTCLPRLVLPIEPGKPAADSLSTFMFVHEMAHVAQAYWQRAPEYLAAGGIKNAGAYNKELSWQFEGDAQFSARHSPEAYGYDDAFPNTCPFEPLRRGAYAWKDFAASTGDAQILPYQMGIFVDQLTWHRFGKDPSWIYQWFVAQPDPRSTDSAPYTATRRLMKLVSKDATKTDLKSFNNVLLQAGVDLYLKGKNPWTTRQLGNECIRSSASVELPLLAFDALRVELGDLANVTKLRLSLDASRDRDFLKAGVAAVELDEAGKPKFIECLKGITENGLSSADPRTGCMQTVFGLSALTAKNDYTDDVKLPITFQSGRKYAVIGIVAHLLKRPDAPRTPITVTLRAEPVSTPPANKVAKSECGALTDAYRSHCKTSNCLCIGNAYCEATVDPPPASCEKVQQGCYAFCVFQKDECDCTSFCDRLYSKLGCH